MSPPKHQRTIPFIKLPLFRKQRSMFLRAFFSSSDHRSSSPQQPLATFLKSHSHTLQHRFHTAKRDARVCLTNATTLLLILFLLLLVFTIGAKSELGQVGHAPTQLPTPTPLSPPPYSPFAPHHPTPLQYHLHNYFTVPWRYLNLLTAAQRQTLFSLLSSPIQNSTIPNLKRRIVFTHVSACRLQQCLRAISTAVAYAQVSSRIALIFVDAVDGTPLTNHLLVADNSMLAKHAMLISVTPNHQAFALGSDAFLQDWAEFSVVDAVVDSDVPTGQFKSDASSLPVSSRQEAAPLKHNRKNNKNGSSASQDVDTNRDENNQDEEEDDDEEGERRRSTIGNTKIPATLDNLAATDSHISVTLSEVFWSRYVPRTIQEQFLHNLFSPVSSSSAAALASASLLGRHSTTRTISRTDQTLHEVFDIPHMLLRGMRPLARKLLLLKLQMKVRRGVANPKTIFVHTQYGLGNRLRALGSGMAFARRTNRVLVLIWVPDQHLNCRYTDLFVSSDEFITADAFEAGEDWPFGNNSMTDVKMRHVKWYNFMRVNGMKVMESSDGVVDDKQMHVYVSTCYVIQSSVTPFIIRTTSSYWSVLKSLTPHVNVVRLVERFASYPVSSMIGIHIRGKSIKKDISGINEKDYSVESSRTTDYWRNLTQVDTFIEEMKRQTADQLFYVAADQKEVFTQLETEFPSRVFYTPRDCDSRDKDCLPFALADILLLAKCSSLRGSYWSSFSELSTRIGGARFLLAGVDFGRP